MVQDFLLPDLGEGLTESELISWRVAVGDHVELNQIVAEVETAKAVVELPCPFEGTVTALHANPGETVPVGAPLLSCEVSEGAAETARQPTLVGYGAGAESGRRRARRVGEFGSVTGESAGGETAAHDRPRSTPPVRALARELGVDLATVVGTGEGGVITRDDVQRAAGSAAAPSSDAPPIAAHTLPAAVQRPEVPPAAAAVAASQSPTAATRVPIRGVRKLTAEAMVKSAFTAPHVTVFLTVDVTAMMELVRAFRADPDFDGHRVTPLTFAARAVCDAVRRTPEVNSDWDADTGEIVQYHSVNLGIAAATDRGLIVPNIKGADQLGFVALADRITLLAETARAGRTAPADLAGGTFTITNVGVFGVDAGTPIINPGEAAILALGRARRQPWEYRGEIALREVTTLALSFDHRLVDGQQGSTFLAEVGRLLEQPGLALSR
ncbi:MAG TPA: dihydrolipoamide acetyltransferase family protein [Candidatus Lumbricidophila sp.]|nr:dihydrolipoamide acetyltransferase family protein [Candidatus Lumbricidophila sp.]